MPDQRQPKQAAANEDRKLSLWERISVASKIVELTKRTVRNYPA